MWFSFFARIYLQQEMKEILQGYPVFLLQMLCLELANKGQGKEKVRNVMAICKAVKKSISYNPHINYYYDKL